MSDLMVDLLRYFRGQWLYAGMAQILADEPVDTIESRRGWSICHAYNLMHRDVVAFEERYGVQRDTHWASKDAEECGLGAS